MRDTLVCVESVIGTDNRLKGDFTWTSLAPVKTDIIDMRFTDIFLRSWNLKNSENWSIMNLDFIFVIFFI